MSAGATPSQAWAILARHARDEIGPLRLRELCADNSRVSSLVAAHTLDSGATARIEEGARNAAAVSSKSSSSSSGGGGGGGVRGQNSDPNRILIVDMSRQLITLETLNHLLRLSSAVDIRGFIQTLAWGQNDRLDPIGVRPEDTSPIYQANKMRLHAAHEQSQRTANVMSSPNASPLRLSTSGYPKKTRFDDDATAASVRSVVIPPSPSHSPSSPSHRSISSNTYHLPSSNHGPPRIRNCPSMHLALRVPAHASLRMLAHDGSNAVESVHAVHGQIRTLSESIRRGLVRGIGGHTLQNILVLGRGVAHTAIKFVYGALRREEAGAAALVDGLSDLFPSLGSGRKSNLEKDGRRMRFLSSADPVATTAVLADWEPEYTLVVTLVPKGDETDVLRLTHTVQDWLYNGLKSHSKRHQNIFGKHIYLVTGSESLYHSERVTQLGSTFLIPQYARCEAFNTFTAAGLLPLSITFGWTIVQELINGAHDIDSHFVETNPRHNLPVLLALVDLWNDRFLPETSRVRRCGGGGGRTVTPFMDSFKGYPSFVAAVEAQVCGRVGGSGRTGGGGYGGSSASSALVIDGGTCGTYDRVSYQGGRAPPAEMIVAMESQVPHRNRGRYGLGQTLLGGGGGYVNTDPDDEDDYESGSLTNHDHLFCSFFAHADAMAFGGGGDIRNQMHQGRGGSVAGGACSVSGGGGGGVFASTSFDVGFGGDQSVSYPVQHQHSQNYYDQDVAEGNRPSTLIVCGRCDAFACGQLIALAEHRALVSARLWGVDHKAFAPTHASELRSRRTDLLREKLVLMYDRLASNGGAPYQEDGEEDFGDNLGPRLNLSATSLLGHYAQRMQTQEQWDGRKRK